MRVLVIDEEQKYLNLLQQQFATQGYEVDIAADGRSGLKLASESLYDLIVLDLMLPEMNSIEVLRRLQRQTSSVPVLIVSACSSAEDRAMCKEAGADDYLAKPFDAVELLSCAKVLLGHVDAHEANIVRVGDLELDRRSRRATRGAQKIELGSKKYDLLEFLMNNAGHFVSRNMIIEHVWDESFGTVGNLVDVYVSQLRNKIDGGRAAKLVHVVHGIGYSICEQEPEAQFG